jgi:hypothetical protein
VWTMRYIFLIVNYLELWTINYPLTQLSEFDHAVILPLLLLPS